MRFSELNLNFNFNMDLFVGSQKFRSFREFIWRFFENSVDFMEIYGKLKGKLEAKMNFFGSFEEFREKSWSWREVWSEPLPFPSLFHDEEQEERASFPCPFSKLQDF